MDYECRYFWEPKFQGQYIEDYFNEIFKEEGSLLRITAPLNVGDTILYNGKKFVIK